MTCETVASPVVFERPSWNMGDVRKIYGSSQSVEVRAGMYFDEDYGFGTYYSQNGRTYLCNQAKAQDMALSEDVDFARVDAGKCSGGVYNSDYRYLPGTSL